MTAMGFFPPKFTWKTSPNYYRGRNTKNDLIVIHDTEGGYSGAIGTFLLQRSQRSVSAHFVLKEDGSECTQMVSLNDSAWHVSHYNGRSTGIEMAGFFAKGFSEAEWDHAAWLTAYLAHHLGIPPRCGLQSGQIVPGIVRHRDLGALGGGHVDPTAKEAVWAHFLEMVGRHTSSAIGFDNDFGIRGMKTSKPLMTTKFVPELPKFTLPTPVPVRDVKWIQTALRTLGVVDLDIDGDLGPNTALALRGFRAAAGIKEPELAGPLTIAALDRALMTPAK